MAFPSSRAATLALSPLVLWALGGCAGAPAPAPRLPGAAELASACPLLGAGADAPVAKTAFTNATVVAATATTPEHCLVEGEINRRTGIDGQSYAIRFRVRMPTAGWNGRFYMGGGGGTNGSIADPIARVEQGYATVGTDSGHDNTTNNVPSAGGTAAFGLDPQTRIDFGYSAYDQVTQVGKWLVQRFYLQPAMYAYYVGCSEGGREGLLMAQRFPQHYDGIVSGDPVLHLPLGPMSGVYTTQLFAGLANRAGLRHANGTPAINKTYSDTDLLLMRNAVLAACDSLDGLADGIVDNQPACTTQRVSEQFAALQCTGAKTDACLTADQIATMRKAYEGTFDSRGRQLYSDWQWDAGIGGLDGTTYNPSWRSWWLGYRKMSEFMGSRTQDFARMYVVPGMAHCSGGPATDSFDMLPQLVEWVEQGKAPEAVVARASNPGYFGVAARTRPLCPYPKQARYNGSGDINDAANFSCR